MRISITYLYTIFRYGYPHSVDDALKALPEIRKLGFRYLEMEGLGARHLRALNASRKRLAAVLEDQGLHVHNFCVVDPDLVSLDEKRRGKALDLFKLGAELAASIGSETLHLASYAPPVRYVEGRPYQLAAKGGYKFAGPARVRIPKGFDWNRVWDALVSSCQACCEVAEPTTVLMEPRVGEVICSVDSLLRLIEHVGQPNLKANFDTGHFAAQRENVPLALMKLCGKFANIHISDNIPVDTEHLPVGDGIIDWQEFFRVLKVLGYDGYLGLDLGTRKPLVAGYRRSVKRIQQIAREQHFKVEV